MTEIEKKQTVLEYLKTECDNHLDYIHQIATPGRLARITRLVKMGLAGDPEYATEELLECAALAGYSTDGLENDEKFQNLVVRQAALNYFETSVG